MSETSIVKKSKKISKVLLFIANILVIAALSFTSVFFFLKYHDLMNSNLSDDQKIAKYEKEISKTSPKNIF